MTHVDSARRGHPGPLQSDNQQGDIDKELEWVLQKDETDSVKTVQSRPNSAPPRSHTPSTLSSPHTDRNIYDTPYPRSPSPKLSPREEQATGPLRMEADEDEDDAQRFGGEPHSVNQADDSGDDGEYNGEMTADQKMAMKELHEMKLDLAYAEEEPPEYDVKERVRQLNEELAKEPSPTGHERSITFKENPVSLVVPPPEYPSDDEDAKPKLQTTTQDQTEIQGQSEGKGDTGMEVLKDDESIDSDRGDRAVESVKTANEEQPDAAEEEVVEELASDNEQSENRKYKHTGEGDKHSDTGSDAGSDKNSDKAADHVEAKTNKGEDGEKVLVERNGKFELVSVDTLSAEERQLYLPAHNIDKDTQSDSSKASSKSSETKPTHQPHPPRQPRPATANVSHNQDRERAAPRRAQSAKTRQTEYTTYEDYGYNSPYALTSDEKRQLKREKNKKDEQQKKKEEEDKDKKQQEQDQANDAFQAWLKQKRRDASLRRKEENERNKKETEETENKDGTDNMSDCSKRESSFKEWLDVKQKDKRRTRSVERAIRREQQEQYTVRPRAECDKAFRGWVRKKNGELRKQKVEDYNKNRVMRLLARQSRKSHQLAQAMTHAQAFKYVDYYGYRF